MQALSSSRARAAFGSRPIAASTAPRRAVVVCVKPSKAAEFRALNNEEIVAKIGELKKEYVRLSYYQQTRGATLSPDNKEDPNPEKTPKGHEFKHTRRQIAQLWTGERGLAFTAATRCHGNASTLPAAWSCSGI